MSDSQLTAKVMNSIEAGIPLMGAHIDEIRISLSLPAKLLPDVAETVRNQYREGSMSLLDEICTAYMDKMISCGVRIQAYELSDRYSILPGGNTGIIDYERWVEVEIGSGHSADLLVRTASVICTAQIPG